MSETGGGKRPREHPQEGTLQENLSSQRWVVRDMLPDGNCLFRGVADQVFGDPNFCDKVREQTVDHMSAMRTVYSQFVAEDDFDAYLARMRRNGEVADHPEIQAMAELYGRPVVVYAADSGVVTTFHCGRDEPEKLEKSEKTDAVEKTDSVSLPPIRLLYINGDHYNSIVDIIRPSIGAGLGEPQLDRVANVGTEQMLVDRTLMLTELEQTEKTLIEAAAMEELQDEMLTQLRENDERTLISASLQQSEADSDRLLAAAIRDSAQDEDSLLQAALEASEQEMLQQMLQESQRSNWAPPNSNN